MKKLFALLVLTALMPVRAFAHRLDEYLQATILSIDSTHIEGSLRLVPGVAVASSALAGIDTNGDGVLSDVEQQTYARKVLGDLVLKVNNQSVPIQMVSAAYPSTDQVKQGTGEIMISFTADLPEGAADRRLVFENHHEPTISVYLVNCLVPTDTNIQLGAQSRNTNQSFYQLDFTEGAGASASRPSLSGFAGAFRLGVRHIAEGTDHLLFLLTLLLPAPLLASAGRWRQRATVRRSLLQIVRIVTAFTVGHSLTLALSAFGLLSLPSRPVEVLIAVSILVSAIHAIRPLFPGREAVIAAFFGLIHGLAFASALTELGFDHWYRLVSVLGFNLGIEAMQLAVVAVTLPSLLLLSRTPVYASFRNAGALFACVASTAWIMERAFDVPNAIGPVIESSAHYAPWIAVSLFMLSVMCWRFQRIPNMSNDLLAD